MPRSVPPDRDLYVVLGLAPTADQRAVAAAYRRLVRRYHPDVCREPGAERRIREINAAYEVLGDPAARLRYDRARVGRVGSTVAWQTARRAWGAAAYRPGPSDAGPPPEARVRISPGALHFGFLGRGEIATKTIVVRAQGGGKLSARLLTRGDWLQVDQAALSGDEATVKVTADPRALHAFWLGPGPETGRLDGWLEVVDRHGSLRVPAGAILRRDHRTASWWNPFASRVG